MASGPGGVRLCDKLWERSRTKTSLGGSPIPAIIRRYGLPSIPAGIILLRRLNPGNLFCEIPCKSRDFGAGRAQPGVLAGWKILHYLLDF